MPEGKSHRHVERRKSRIIETQNQALQAPWPMSRPGSSGGHEEQTVRGEGGGGLALNFPRAWGVGSFRECKFAGGRESGGRKGGRTTGWQRSDLQRQEGREFLRLLSGGKGGFEKGVV